MTLESVEQGPFLGLPNDDIMVLGGRNDEVAV
jgi:hypothetical protein